MTSRPRAVADPRAGPRLRHRRLRGPRRASRGAGAPSARSTSSVSAAASARRLRALAGGHWASSCTGRAARRCRRTSSHRSASTRGARDPARLGRVVGAARGGARGGRRRRPAAAADDRERRLRDPQGRPLRPAVAGGPARAAAAIMTVFSPKGGTGKTVIATNLAASRRQVRGEAHAPARPRPPVRRRRDHAGARAREDDLRPGRRAGRARPREARGLRHAPRVRARHPPGAAAPGGRRARDRGEAGASCSRSRGSPTT